MKIVTPLRLGVLGTLCFLSGIAWVTIWNRFVHRAGLGWYLDIAPPVAPRLIGMAGILLAVISLVWLAISWVERKLASSKKLI